MGILTSRQLVERIGKEYSSPKAKITQMLKQGQIYHLKRGWYADSLSTSAEIVAMALVPMSYISLQSALRHYGMIPDAVMNYTLASPCVERKVVYTNDFGSFLYYPVPLAAAGQGLLIEKLEDGMFFIASREKALMDLVYRVKGITTVNDMILFLLEDMRMEEEELASVDISFIESTAHLYGREKEYLLASALKKIRRRN